MEVVKNAMENIPDELRLMFEKEAQSAHAKGIGTKKNKLSKGEKKRAKRDRRKYGYS